MAITLRSFRYEKEDTTLVVEECASRQHVAITMTGGPVMAPTELSVLLDAESWRSVVDFDPLNQSDEDEIQSVLRVLTVVEEGRDCSLEVSQLFERTAVRLFMRADATDDEMLTVDLDGAEWAHLAGLDLIDPDRSARLEPPTAPAGPDEVIH